MAKKQLWGMLASDNPTFRENFSKFLHTNFPQMKVSFGEELEWVLKRIEEDNYAFAVVCGDLRRVDPEKVAERTELTRTGFQAGIHHSSQDILATVYSHPQYYYSRAERINISKKQCATTH